VILANLLVHNVDFFIVDAETNLLLEFTDIRKNIKVRIVEGIRVLHFVVFFEAGTHQVSMDLKLSRQVTFICFTVQ
jgi:hypothetical protein